MYECQTSSSSSSSLSGVTAPPGSVPPKLVQFPKCLSSKAGLTSSDSSLSLLDRHRVCSLSFTKSPLSPTQRPVRLSLGSLGSAKATPVPAIPSSPEEHSSLGAFNLTSSAEGHLRSLVTRIASPCTPSKFTDATEAEILKTRARIITAFVPCTLGFHFQILRKKKRRSGLVSALRHVTMTCLLSVAVLPHPNHLTLKLGAIRTREPFMLRFDLFGKAETHSKLRKPKHVRANSYAGPSAPQLYAVSNLRLAEAGQCSASSISSVPRAFLRPPMKNKGKAASRSPHLRGHSSIQPKERPLPLNPTLAVVESACAENSGSIILAVRAAVLPGVRGTAVYLMHQQAQHDTRVMGKVREDFPLVPIR